MDTLAGYGSDSSSDAKDELNSSRREQASAKNDRSSIPKKENDLSGLLGAVDDDDEDESEGDGDSEGSSNRHEVKSIPATQEQQSPPSKKVRLDNDNDNVQESMMISLPDPPLATESSSASASMIYWETNYLKLLENENPFHQETPLSLKELSDTKKQVLSLKLQQLARKWNSGNSSSSSSCWADYLKSQHEFHNPHFFESVVEHFGIASPLGSQMDVHNNDDDDMSILKDYEQELFPFQPNK